MEQGPGFLKEKYGLHKAPEVEQAARRKELREGAKVPQTPEAQIQAYLDRFKEIIERKDLHERERGMQALKQILYDKFVIKQEDIPEAYFETQRRIAREQGHGEIEITDEIRKQAAEVIITDQKSSLDTWIDYLTSEDAPYPDFLKYFAFRSILGMSEYDKEKKQFAKRSKGTTKPFPDLNREALAYVLDAIEKKRSKRPITTETLAEEERKEFEKLLQGENFAKLYAYSIEKVTPASQEALAKTAGKWVKYEQGSDHMPLVASLQGHGTGWCTAGESTAQTQLAGGDFYVYYSFDQDGKPKIPRVAIRMQENRIAEIRGIASEQNLDPYIGDVLEKKLAEFGSEGKSYKKKSADMKLLTEIDRKTKAGKPLTKDDLFFLYEINTPIEGFGYQRDPRIQEIRSQRNPEEDALIVFECQKEQIARFPQEINEHTKAYIGKLKSGIFDLFQKYNIEHIYTEFPEGKIRSMEITIGGKSKEELITELKKKFIVSDYAEDMLRSKDFTTLKNPEEIKLVRLTIRDLGFENDATTEQIFKRAKELGLELCPAEVGPYLRMQYTDQPMGEYFWISMKQIPGPGGDPGVFRLDRNGVGLWLYNYWARPVGGWGPDGEFVFRLRKKES